MLERLEEVKRRYRGGTGEAERSDQASRQALGITNLYKKLGAEAVGQASPKFILLVHF